MSLKSTFVGCITALFGATGCTSTPDKHEIERLMKALPDYTVTNPETGCRYIKDDKNPDKPQPCIINDFPQRHVK